MVLDAGVLCVVSEEGKGDEGEDDNEEGDEEGAVELEATTSW